jgi:hypothetical protein
MLNYLPKAISGWQVPRVVAGNAAGNNQVHLPLLSLHKIKAIRYWVLAQHRKGLVEEDTPNEFDDDVAVATLTLMCEGKDYKHWRRLLLAHKCPCVLVGRVV